MDQNALFADMVPASGPAPPPAKARVKSAAKAANIPPSPTGPAPAAAEIATVEKAEFLSPITVYQYPNLSTIIRNRAQGQGLRFYDTMLVTDPDLNGLVKDLFDDVLHSPYVWAPSDPQNPAAVEQAKFCEDVFESIRYKQSALRNILWAYFRGFSVTEKMYEVAGRGPWRGAVTYADLLDKPSRWFSFDPDRQLRLMTFTNFLPGELVPQQKFIVATFGSTSDPWGRPIADDVYWAWFLKHHLMKQRAIFMERWASPTAVASYKWDSNNEKVTQENVKKALAALAAIQTQQGIGKPEGIDLTLLESARSGSISFDQAVDALTEMESRCITGQVLSSMGTKGGSFALGKVHEKRESNKVDMLCDFLSEQVSWTFRDLVIRNWGEQDGYPKFVVLSKDSLEKQGDADVDLALQKLGLPISKSFALRRYQTIAPTGPDDVLVPNTALSAEAVPAVNPALSATDKAEKFAFAPRPLYHAASQKASAAIQKRATISEKSKAQAKPAISGVVKAIASGIRRRKSLASVSKATMIKSIKGHPSVDALHGVFSTMLGRADAIKMAAGDNSDEDAIKAAIALELATILDAINKAKADAPNGMEPGDFADSLTDPNGIAIDDRFAGLFNATHDTDIASIAASNLRAQLADPAFRAKNPYVMRVVTNPNARASHRLMDGYVMSAEDAATSPDLAPLDFGCDCVDVPISADEAKTHGLVGAAPTGSLNDYARQQGASPFSPIGKAPGFVPAAPGTHMDVQLAALRQKAEALRAEDPEAWLAWRDYLFYLFGFDVLRHDSKEDSNAA